MLEQRFRNIYQKIFIDPIINLASKYLKSIWVTIASGIAGVAIIPLLVYGHNLWAIGLLLVSGFLDTLDGSIARHQNSSSNVGGALDIFTDRVVEGLVILGLFLVDPSRSFLCLLMFFANSLCVTAFLVVGVFVEQESDKSFFYHNGLMERTEAFIFFGLMMLIPEYFNPLAYIYTFLVILTALLHVRYFIKWDNTQP